MHTEIRRDPTNTGRNFRERLTWRVMNHDDRQWWHENETEWNGMESQEMLLVCNNRPSFSPLLSSSLCLIWIFEICPHTPEHENDKMKSIKKSLTRIRFYSCYTFFKRWIWRPFIWIQRDIHCSRTKFDQTINFIIL